MKRLLALLECSSDGAYQTNVFVDYDCEGEFILESLARVELADAELNVGKAVERAGEVG